jgi:tryptophan-rich sensory protein
MDSSVAPRRPAALDLFGFGLAGVVVAVVGGLASASAGEQYAALEQPSRAPPTWLFGPAWTVLYALIALSGRLVRRQAGVARARTALTVYAVQLGLNMLWTTLFFGAGLFGIAFAEIVLLWLAIVATIVLFGRIHRLAAGLLAPYLLWVTVAGALNLSIWLLN